MAYVLALPTDICEILMKFVIHILKALDKSYTKMQEKIEITTNHLLQFSTKIPKNGYCDEEREALRSIKKDHYVYEILTVIYVSGASHRCNNIFNG